MNKVQVLAFVGMPGSGKSSCTEYVVKKGFPSVYFGGVILEEVKARGLEVNAENEKIVREDVRAEEGKEAFAKRIVARINALQAAGHSKIVADGIYSWSEYKYFKDAYADNVSIVAIAAPRSLRHQRLANRPVRPLSEEEANARDYAEIENLEKGGPIANADFTIVNDAEESLMYQQLDKILGELGFSN